MLVLHDKVVTRTTQAATLEVMQLHYHDGEVTVHSCADVVLRGFD